MAEQDSTRSESDDSVAAGRDAQVDELGTVIGANLKRLRTKRNLSLEALARLSGVSRAMIGQIEAGRSMPTIGLLFKITRALDIPFAALMGASAGGAMIVLEADKSKVLASRDGAFRSRALFPFGSERRVEFYELTLSPHAAEKAEPHAVGTTENLTVTAGEVEITAAGDCSVLRPGDSVFFQADVPHSYRNLSDREAVMYLVMTYAQSQG